MSAHPDFKADTKTRVWVWTGGEKLPICGTWHRAVLPTCDKKASDKEGQLHLYIWGVYMRFWAFITAYALLLISFYQAHCSDQTSLSSSAGRDLQEAVFIQSPFVVFVCCRVFYSAIFGGYCFNPEGVMRSGARDALNLVNSFTPPSLHLSPSSCLCFFVLRPHFSS